MSIERRYPHPPLHSPAKQIAFLMGLLLATDEPAIGRDFTDRDWENAAKLLGRLFQVYAERYMPDQEQFKATSISELKKQELAILAFTNYFQEGTLATDEQILDHIRAYVVPFNGHLSKSLGFSASDALAIVQGIVAKFQIHIDSLEERSTPQAALSGYRIGRNELIAQHGEKGDTFWKMFTVGRGEGNDLQYPNEQSIVERRPFIRLSENVAFGCKWREMLLPILAASEDCLLNGPREDTYLRHRARTLEEQTASFMKQILGGSTKVYQNLFETPDNQNEHDIVVLSDDICLFVEVKSSPPDAPFRDPEKAYTRLRRNFRSDTGIQKAYDQASRLLRSVRSSEVVTLYDREGNEALQLPGSLPDVAYCVCVTRDSYGPAATCLSFLLEKEESEPYPWVANVWNLENIAEIWKYYGWDGRQLRAFLSARAKLHTSLFGDDELDYVGAFIMHCGLEHFVADTVFPAPINPTYSEIFDAIHRHLRRGGPPVRIDPVYPSGGSVEELFQTGETVSSMRSRQKPIKLNRNEWCPCGSGVKSKRCHGAL